MRLEAVTVKNMCARKLQRLVQEAFLFKLEKKTYKTF